MFKKFTNDFGRDFQDELETALTDLDTNTKKVNLDLHTTKGEFNGRVDELITKVPQPSEVVDARMGEATLRGKLEKVDAELAQNQTHINNVAVNLEDYFQDGDTNYTNAFTRAFNYLKSVRGGRIILPAKTIDATIKIPSYCGIIGSGRGSVIRTPVGSIEHTIQLETNQTKFILLQDFSIDGNKVNQTTPIKGISLINSTTAQAESLLGEWDARHTIKNIFIRNCKGYGFEIAGRGESQVDNVQVRSGDDVGMYLDAFDNWYSNLSSGENKKAGIVVTNNSGNCRFVNCKGWNNGKGATDQTEGYGFKIINAKGCMFSACEAQANAHHGFAVFEGRANVFSACNSEVNGYRDSTFGIANSAGFYLKDSKHNAILGVCKNNRGVTGGVTQDYAVSLEGDVQFNNIVITADCMKLGGLNDISTKQRYNNVNIVSINEDYSETTIRNVNANYIGIGTLGDKSVSPIMVDSKSSENQRGAQIKRSVTDNTVANIVATFEGYNELTPSQKVTLDIIAALNSNELIMQTYGKTLRSKASFAIDSGAWDKPHLLMGGWHIWVDSLGRLRIKGSAPTSDTDGTLIGTQT